MRAERGIALPTVIIILLLTASAAGWILYFKNQKTLAAMVGVEDDLTSQTNLTRKAEQRAEELQSQLDTTSAERKAVQSSLDEANQQLTSLRNENSTIPTLNARIAEGESAMAALKSQLTEQQDTATTLRAQLSDRSNAITELETQLAEQTAAAASLTAERDQVRGEATSLQRAVLGLEAANLAASDEISNLATARDQALDSDQRGRTQLAGLLAQVESGQQNSAAYLAQLDAARSELATTSEQANLLQERLRTLEAEHEKERAEFRALQEKLNAELGKESVEIDQPSKELTVIRLQDDVLFNSGSARLLNSAQGALSSISGVLQRYPERLIQVEGHTDNIPLSKQSRYPTNWELSAARASAAVRYLINSTDIDPQRLRVAGLGEYNPIADNTTADGRAQNRRIEITLLPANALREVSASNN